MMHWELRLVADDGKPIEVHACDVAESLIVEFPPHRHVVLSETRRLSGVSLLPMIERV